MNQNQPWYGVKTLLYNHSGKMYEERVLVYEATSIEDAESKAMSDTTAYVKLLKGYDFIGVIDVFHMFDKHIHSGLEVFSQMIRSELTPEQYIERFYDLDPTDVLINPEM